jgi:hypothetical protein
MHPLRTTSLFAFALTGCVVAPAMPPLTTPRGSDLRRQGAALAAGVTMPPFGGTYVRDGRRIDVVHVPRYSVLALQMIALEGRRRVGEACDLGVQLGLGRSGGEFRCGLGDERATLAARASLQWVYTEGATARLMVDAGYRHRGWLVFASTGLGVGGYYGRTLLGEESLSSFEDLLVSPGKPVAVVSQWELMWSSVVTLGVPLQGRTLSGFGGVSVDVPAAYTAGEFTVLGGGRAALSDFRPGIRVGVMLGFSGILSP